MKPNTNPETGVAYGVIAMNNLDQDVAQELWYGPKAKDLTYEEVLNDVREAVEREADRLESESPEDPQGVYAAIGYGDREDYVEAHLEREMGNLDISEPVIEGTYEGVSYKINWLGGAPLLWVIDSPIIIRARPCSPCVPGAGDLDSLDTDTGIECYDVPPTWRDTSPWSN